MKIQMAKWLVATLVLTTTMSPSAALAEHTSKSSSFVDVGDVAKAKQDAILQASQQGLLDGDPNGQFRPRETLTRQELAALLVRALNLPLPAGPKSSYQDVAQGDWGSAYIEAVKQAGLMNGDGGSFRPNDSLTREELATVFARAVHAVGTHGGLDTQLRDQGKVSSWAGDAVDAAVRLGLIDTPDEQLNPTGLVQRQDIAGFLLDIFQSGERSATITKVEGDVVTIDGKPFLVDDKLKKLLGDRNQQALVGAVLKYKSTNRSVGDLSELEIVQSGVTLDTSGATFDGSLRIAADKVAVKGNALQQVVLKKGVSSVTLDSAVKQVVLDTDQKVTLNGTGKLQELQVTNIHAQVVVGNSVSIEKIQLPDNVKLSQVIQNLDQVKRQIKDVQGGVDDRSNQTPSPTPTPAPTPVNHKPTVVTQPGDLTKVVTGGPMTVSVANVFADADGDALTYTAVSSATNVATVVVNGSQLVITPVNAGTSEIAVTADDGKGGTEQVKFHVTFEPVVLPPVNHAPTVQNVITPVTVTVGDNSQSVSLANVFTDADADMLTLDAVSSATDVATVSVDGNDLAITPLQAGTTTITVSANDGNGGVVQTTFTITVEEIKTLFFSELVWGQDDPNLQIIELFNPTGQPLDASKIRIERMNGGAPIVIENSTVPASGTFTIGESFYFGDVAVDYNSMMNFYEDDSQPVELHLFYDNVLVDIAIFTPHKSLGRVSGTVHGTTSAYDSAQWNDEGVDNVDDLGQYTP
ncbi:S-layer homology domain-containing protein [Tumebacillus permanentifrigoris]|uniref:S-layer family protein n=1 Tax=Tumebacillus permanentifrigoris TaxID=378543 RepID=A0A316DCI8_9BACL|nr:S-layer homology domain-containing protein [Tumebacillus permanentifrigoris]PWK14903.1 S-layer family protein [Tumebacillus permanentifrigoris]